uniref:Secreted protein n=1 Tax=Daphnia galeata TaxID=27404 RepID=A0A8J2WS39_9CRUS|nr:unnamed protein product [Daphnia galeata]
MAKFATALVLVTLIAVTLATAFPPRRNRNKVAISVQPASVQPASSSTSNVAKNMHNISRRSAVPYNQVKKYNVQPSYDMAGSNYGSAYAYQKHQAYVGYPSY